MSTLARKYLKPEYKFEYAGSLFSMKPILKASEIDDSSYSNKKLSENPTFVSVLSGKINTIYDMDEVLKMINNKEKKFMSAVVYLHNNENQIEKFLTIVLEVFERNYERYEIILVDDASSDNTVRKVHDIAEKSTGGVITVVNMSFFQGLEKSMNAGVDLAIGDFVYEFDTVEIDYDPKLIMDIYYKAQEGFDIVAISNKNEKLSSKLFYYVFNLNNKNKIVTQTFSIISRRAINRVKSNTLTIPYRKAVYQILV